MLSFVLYRSTFEVDTRDPKHPVVLLEVLINGVEAYKYVTRKLFL